MSTWGAQGTTAGAGAGAAADASGYAPVAWSPPTPMVAEPLCIATPSAPIVVVLRVLIAVGVVLGLTTLASRPVERPVSDLLAGIAAGDVTAVTIERWDPATTGGGMLHVGWTQDGRPAESSYSYENPQGTVRVDGGEAILRTATKAHVPVTTVSRYDTPEGFQIPIGVWGLAATFAALILLVAGDRPRWATRWAWFWVVAAVPPAWLVYLVLEPLPVWANRPAVAPRTRLSGGWAFFAAVIVLRPILEGLLGPQWSFLLGG